VVRHYADRVPQLRIALAQVDAVVGDLEGNAKIVLDRCREAAAQDAHLVVFPEMMLTGYPIEDLAMRASVIAASRELVDALAGDLQAQGLGDLVVYVGYLDRAEGVADGPGVPKNAPTNSVAVLHGGRVVARQAKHHLWNYGVGDEMRTFVAGHTLNVVQVHGVDVALAICEDIWQEGPSAAARAAEASLLVVPNGSPYEANKDDVRYDLVSRRAREGDCTVAYVNTVGGQDELVFEGDSIVVGPSGDVLARGAQFAEELLVVDLDLPAATPRMPDPEESFGGLRIQRTIVSSEPLPAYEPRPAEVRERLDDLGERYFALVTGLRGYVEKNGFRSVLMGLSGGIDSTLCGAIAVDALGADRVFGVSNPSAWSTEHSRSDAAELARRTGLRLDTVPIASILDSYEELLDLEGLAEENLQARIRANIWMALSNRDGHLVLACGNKSELATGYSTIYGDAVGGYAPLKDVPKTIVWELSRWRNAHARSLGQEPPIPEHAIAKPPSAELRPGQLDSDSLPPYEILDAILDAYVERDLGYDDVLAEGFDPEVVKRVVTLVDRAEYKRRQYPPGPKISRRNFGRDRRVPITNRWREHA
jgi:NAD+ synthase (glutamine-hydrolysing)